MIYNPVEYWKERGKVYLKDFRFEKYKDQERILLKHLDNVNDIKTIDSVLELGCGFGRITKLLLNRYPNIKEYLAIDISPDQIENAKKYVSYGIWKKKINFDFQVTDIESFKPIDKKKKYDLVILCEVLLHIPPYQIQSTINKCISLSNRHIINIDWYEEVPPKKIIAEHNFIHDYLQIYKWNPEVMAIARIPITEGFRKNQYSIFHAIKKDPL
jgi:SAM-dependent methyltransferase